MKLKDYPAIVDAIELLDEHSVSKEEYHQFQFMGHIEAVTMDNAYPVKSPYFKKILSKIPLDYNGLIKLLIMLKQKMADEE